MAKYRIYLESTASASVEIEADSEEEAIEAVWAEEQVELPWSCHQCPEITEWVFPPDEYPDRRRGDYITKIED